MGIIDAIIRSRYDLVKPKQRSYAGLPIRARIISTETIIESRQKSYAHKRLLAHELSGKEPVREVIVLDCPKDTKKRLTTVQVKDLLSDMGFHVDALVSSAHESDFNAVMNIQGFVVPGYEKVVLLLCRMFPRFEKLLLTRLAPGKERLHIRGYEMNDGSWVLSAHTDWNWMSVHLVRVFHSHLTTGAGDYEMGTALLKGLLERFLVAIQNNRAFRYSDIWTVTKSVYYRVMADRISQTENEK